jgi:ATP-dependent DNA helicase RecG
MANTEGGRIEVGRTSEGIFIGLDAKDADEAQRKLFDAAESVKPSPAHRIDVVSQRGRYLVRIDVARMAGTACSLGGIFYVRSGSVNQKLEGGRLLEFLSRRMIVEFDSIASSAKVDDCGDDLLRRYLKVRSPKLDFDPSRKRQYLMGIHALTDHDAGVLKNGAVLFFTLHPREFIRQHEVRLVRFATTERVDIIDRTTLDSPIPSILDECMAFIRKNTQIGVRTQGLRGVEMPEYPLDGVREALINMIAHRDYLSRDACQVNIHPDRIEFTNPGTLPYGLTISSLGSHAVHRNPLIYEMLRDLDLMEGVGTGVARMRELAKRSGLPPLEFAEVGSFFRVTMRNKAGAALAGRQERLEILVGLVAERGSVSAAEAAAVLGISPAMVALDLKLLIEEGRIIRSGRTRGARYHLGP